MRTLTIAIIILALGAFWVVESFHLYLASFAPTPMTGALGMAGLAGLGIALVGIGLNTARLENLLPAIVTISKVVKALAATGLMRGKISLHQEIILAAVQEMISSPAQQPCQFVDRAGDAAVQFEGRLARTDSSDRIFLIESIEVHDDRIVTFISCQIGAGDDIDFWTRSIDADEITLEV